MHRGAVEERPLGESEVGDGIPMLEPFHVGPILLSIHGSRVAAPSRI
jgi:hypothetical protein